MSATFHGKSVSCVVEVRYLKYILESILNFNSNSLQGSLEFPFTRILMKIFRTRSKEIVTECQNYFSLHTVGALIKSVITIFTEKCVLVEHCL